MTQLRISTATYLVKFSKKPNEDVFSVVDRNYGGMICIHNSSLNREINFLIGKHSPYRWKTSFSSIKQC